MKENRLTYLEGLRGVAALMVFLCHFCYAFYFALYSTKIIEANMPGNLDAYLAVTPLNILYNGKLAVQIFFILCGYVISIKYFKTGNKDYLVKSAVKRYFRLLIPIIFLEVVTFFLMKMGAYHNEAAAVISKSQDWFMNFNRQTPTVLTLLKEIFLDAFLGEPFYYNNVLWIIKYEFLGSLMVYTILYFTGKWKYRDVLYVILILVSIRSFYVSIFIGMFLCDLMHQEHSLVRFCRNKFILLISTLVGLVFATYPAAGQNLNHTFYRYLGTPRVIIFYVIGTTLLFWVLLNSEWMQKLLNNNIFQILGKYSFGIYLIHFPVIATFSAWFLLVLDGKIGYNSIMIINLLVTAVIVFSLAVVFTKYVEPIGTKVGNKVVEKIKD